VCSLVDAGELLAIHVHISNLATLPLNWTKVQLPNTEALLHKIFLSVYSPRSTVYNPSHAPSVLVRNQRIFEEFLARNEGAGILRVCPRAIAASHKMKVVRVFPAWKISSACGNLAHEHRCCGRDSSVVKCRSEMAVRALVTLH
jgi:hypothetical protein